MCTSSFTIQWRILIEIWGLGSKCWCYFEVAEVAYYVSVFLLVDFVLEPEDHRYKLGEAKQLGDDSISPGHNPKDGLAAQVILRQKVHHDCELNSARHRLGSWSHETTLARSTLLARAIEHQLLQRKKIVIEMARKAQNCWLDCQIAYYWMKYPAYTWHAYR